jgi:hypothetical protein
MAWDMGCLEIISFHRENREPSAHALPSAPPIKIDIQTYNQSQKQKAKDHYNIILIRSVLQHRTNTNRQKIKISD